MQPPTPPSLSAIQVRVVRALADCRRTIEAAAMLNMSQSALSRHVQQAEDRLGTQLFQRGWSGSETTGAGDGVARHCQRILETLERLDADAARSRLAIYIRWRHLRCVATVVQLGSASAAAKALGVRQPAISQALREAAGYAGQDLFHRRRTGLEATNTGLKLATAWHQISDYLAEIPQLIDASATGLSGRVAVGMLPYSGQNLVMETFADLTLDHPQVRLIAIPGSYGTLCQALQRGEIDLIIGTLRDPAPQPGFTEDPLYREQYVMIARHNHPCHSVPQTLESLAQYQWSVAPHGTPLRRYFEALFRNVSPPPITQSCEIFSFSNAEQFIMGSESIAMLCYNEAQLEAIHPALKRVVIDLPAPLVPIGLTQVTGTSVPPAVALFVDRLKARIAVQEPAV